ncbi:MAG: DUF58 domain-containing protein [Oscillospiraceae bacterium]|nr:DUF58 domain-containing protein [Oscillospiraceae bacterium]
MKREIGKAIARFLLLALSAALLLAATASPWALGGLLLLLFAPLCSLLLNFHVRRRLRLSVQLPTSAAKGGAVAGSVTVENRAFLPAARIYVRLAIVNDLTGETEAATLPLSVGARSSGSAEFLLQAARCGRLRVRAERPVLMDFLGILPLRVRGEAAARMTVLPDTFSPGVVPHRFAPTREEEGAVNRRGEDRSEVFQLREYRPGDSLKEVHWKLSSKLDELIVREPSQIENHSLLLFWDKRPAASPAAMDALAEVAVSVSQALAELGCRFRLCWTEDGELRWEQVDDPDGLLRAVPALLKSGRSEACAAEPDFAGFGCVIGCTAALPEKAAGGNPTWLLCTETAADAPGVIAFTPENYEETLERLEI